MSRTPFLQSLLLPIPIVLGRYQIDNVDWFHSLAFIVSSTLSLLGFANVEEGILMILEVVIAVDFPLSELGQGDSVQLDFALHFFHFLGCDNWLLASPIAINQIDNFEFRVPIDCPFVRGSILVVKSSAAFENFCDRLLKFNMKE